MSACCFFEGARETFRVAERNLAMPEGDPFDTQRAAASEVTTELSVAGFADLHEIGRGGFGVVYRCLQPALDRIVAVKVLTADLDEGNRARFFREQQAMGRLTGHPNIVTVLHIGVTDDGHPYIVMPYHPQDSLEARIRRHGPLSLEDALRLGVKMAGALETAHRLGILHRDVKPANILLTDYGEPALTDFGIAHIRGGFVTATGTITGSPAYTAPEVLTGEPPSWASDLYGLGATLFSVITGHAAFERRSGEQVIAQFLRITNQPVPDLRDHGIPDDVSAIIEQAMAADPRNRPATAAELGNALRGLQRDHGFPVDELPIPSEPNDDSAPDPALFARPAALHTQLAVPSVRSAEGNLPIELTSFVGRRRELAQVKAKLSISRLVTLTGIGGVGKTRLALRAASDARRGFNDGVWLVELGELRDHSLVLEMVAAVFGIRDRSVRPLIDVVVEFLATRRLLLVLDNCEHLVDAVASLVETLLRTCPDLRILATSREPLDIGGEVVVRVPPLTVPVSDREQPRRGQPQYDAVTLFAERAAAAVPGFEVTADKAATVARICHALDGLPLPIELAAARLRAMSLEQILERLTDRYKLLALGSRGSPTRQQTLRLSVDWSYELCTPREQLVWARLSVFAGVFELDAAEEICAEGPESEDLLDVVAALVDKSILIREEADAAVRFRMLETLRGYGREKSEQSGEHLRLRRRHRDWYQTLVMKVEAEWIGPRQLEWIARLEREQPNLREAMEFCLSEPDDAATMAGLKIVAGLFPYWLSRGFLSEGRRWLDRALARQPRQPTVERAKALYAASVLAEVQGDVRDGAALVKCGHTLADQIADPVTDARIAHAEGVLALYSGESELACTLTEASLETVTEHGDLSLQVWILVTLGLAYDLNGDTPRAIACHEKVLAITESHGESVYRSYSLWALGIAMWREGDRLQARQLLEQCLKLTRIIDEPVTAALCLEALAWIWDEHSAERSAVLLAAAESLGRRVGSSALLFPHLLVYHEECERRTRRALGHRVYEAAHQKGSALGFDEAVAYALDEQPHIATPPAGTFHLTKREREVAHLIAQGLTNKAIAEQLVISQRTAQGHVEHILAKLGFTSRTQVAAWIVEQDHDETV